MAAETIYKLQPDRTLQLRGFDRRGAAAALCEASASGFKVYGVFRDQADFCVLMLWDADNFFEHPRLRYLPDFDFGGMVLTFDVAYDGLQPPDSPKFNWIDWATLDAVRADGSTAQVRLWDYATLQAGTFGVASGTITVEDNGLQAYDRVTLWLQNIAFDYIVPDPATGVTATVVAEALRDQVNQANWPALGPTLAVMASTSGAAITLRAARWGKVDTAGTAVSWRSGEKFTGIAAGSTLYVNGTAYTVASVGSPTALTLTASAGTQTDVKYLAERGGYDGNFVTVYGLWKNNNLKFSAGSLKLAGGSSGVTWRVTIDFTARGIDALRQAWLTFAPRLADGAAYADTEWTATFTNWTVSDPNGKRPLQVAGPGSVTAGSRDAWTSFSGAGWSEEAGFYFRGFARRSKTENDTATVEYHCQHPHDLWVGTSLYTDRGEAGIRLDGDTETNLDCYLAAEPAVVTRRKVRSNVSAGKHVLQVRVKGTKNAASTDTYVYFDHAVAAKPGDAPDPPETYANVTAAIDYDTDHTYKLAPARLVWNLERLGLQGQVNEYVGVFWWNQRKRAGATWKTWTVTFGGTWADGDAAFVTIGGTTLGKSVFPADTADTVAQHFVYFINETFVGVWAEKTAAAGELKVHVRTPVWSFTKSTAKSSAAGTITESGDLSAGVEGTWQIDEGASHPINFPARKWHSDLYGILAGKGWSAAAAYSMELVDPPDDPASGKVFAARYYDGTRVETDVGFAALKSTHCSFVADVAEFQKAVYKETAKLMSDAGLTPWLQFGEFVWWFFSSKALAVTGLSGTEITTSAAHGFATGDVAAIAGTRALDGTRTVTVTAANKFTVSGSAAGSWTGSGQVRGGSMGFYDDDTKAAALAHFGRALAKFTCQDQDPDAVNGGADANWLRGRIKSHIDTIRNHVLGTYAGAKFELLFPYDVAHPEVYHTLELPYPQGGRLNRRVSLPAEYETKAGSGLDRLKMEALSWGAFYRNGARALEAIRFPTVVGSWAKADTAYLLPWFNGGCPWPAEYLAAVNHGVPLIVFWAFDHVCLLGWSLPLPKNRAAARMV